MASKPVLPLPGQQYDAVYLANLVRILNIYFTQLQNPGPLQGTTLNLSELPTSATGLAVGDVWVDTSAGNVLKVVT